MKLDTPPVRLGARHVSRHFTVRSSGRFSRTARSVRAVDDVTLDLVSGRVTAVVGESGSGKSVLAKMLARIVTPTSGELLLGDQVIAPRAKRTLEYAAQVQLVLQDPFSSLNPVHPIHHCLSRPLRIHGTPRERVDEMARGALERVALNPPERFLDRYPHELSGGQLQRVSIARALCVRPGVLLADEPISMLDVSVRLGILNLLRGLCDSEDLAVMYITHDIASARYLADDTIVMYAGQIVERSLGTALVDEPTHPYTQLLVASVPDPTATGTKFTASGEHSNTVTPDVGCRFAPRCRYAMEVCRRESPPEVEVAPGHSSRCWLHEPQRVGAKDQESLTLRRKGAPLAT